MSDNLSDIQKKFHNGSWWVTPRDELLLPSVGKVVSVFEKGDNILVQLQTARGMECFPHEELRRAKLREIMRFHLEQSLKRLEENKK